MNKRYVRRKYRHETSRLRPPRARRSTTPATAELKAGSEFMDATVRRTFGGGLDEIADPQLREAIRTAAERALRRPKRPIPADVLEMAARLRQDGITMTLSACDPRDLPQPVDVGISLSEAILEERYGRGE